MEVDPSSAASTSLAFVVFTRQAQEPRMAVAGEGRGGTTKDTGSQGTTNGHEWTRMAMGRGEEPRKTREAEEPRNTRNTRKKLRNHERTRMDTKKTQNHEWTRMDTNGYGQRGRNHETHEKTQEPRMDTNGHEWIEPLMDTNGHE